MDRAPKFPMPSILPVYAPLLPSHPGCNRLLDQVKLTLDRWLSGESIDQVGGGFARLFGGCPLVCPAFRENAVRDNGQLLTLYSEAYSLTKDPLYKEVVYQTIDFIEREMTNPEGGFYSALDADSEGEEGKFYVWTKAELDEVLGPDSEWFCEYYHVKEEGNWEHGQNILSGANRRKNLPSSLTW